MECSWIMIWVPTKDRERILKKDSKLEGQKLRFKGRKLDRLFSKPGNVNAPANNIDIKEYNDRDAKIKSEKDTKEVRQTSIKSFHKDGEKGNEDKGSHVDAKTLQTKSVINSNKTNNEISSSILKTEKENLDTEDEHGPVSNGGTESKVKDNNRKATSTRTSQPENDVQFNKTTNETHPSILKAGKEYNDVAVLQNIDTEDKRDPSFNQGTEQKEINDTSKDTSTRFQIQRQHTTVLKEESEESGQNTTVEKEESEESEEEVLGDVTSYEEKLEKVLLNLNVQATSLKTKDANYALVTFCLENTRVEDALLRLQENGIGNSPSDTSISVIPASVHFEVPLEYDQNHRYFSHTINVYTITF